MHYDTKNETKLNRSSGFVECSIYILRGCFSAMSKIFSVDLIVSGEKQNQDLLTSKSEAKAVREKRVDQHE
jgi:hypothetical protein